MFQHQGKNLLDRIDKFTLLRVLDLEGCEGISDYHMKCVCGLYLLKFLNLRGTDIRQVPPEINKLEHLQTLDVRDTRVEGLPDTVKELHNLERLQISHSSEPKYMWRLPLGLNKMKSLREVAFSTLGNDAQVAEEIGDLEHLEELSVYADTAMISDGDVLPALAKSLSKSYSLRHLIIGDVGFAKGALDFLHGMRQPPRLLSHLMIAGWWHQWRAALFDALCELPRLKIICVHQMCHVDRELVARARHRFPELSELRVSCNYEEPNVLRFEEGSMAKLETLLFKFIDFEKRIDGVEYLTGLKEVHLWGRKNNPALERALEQLKVENQRRRGEEFVKQFQITVKYE
nr:unnamed protein product [Digitaria exilis]